MRWRACSNAALDPTATSPRSSLRRWIYVGEAGVFETIETPRSDMELLDAFDYFNYPNEIAPASTTSTRPTSRRPNLIEKGRRAHPAERLWINPDCGLKTRQWNEVIPALGNIVAAGAGLA